MSIGQSPHSRTPSVSEALMLARSNPNQALITGSLHFSGEVLSHLRRELAAFEEWAQSGRKALHLSGIDAVTRHSVARLAGANCARSLAQLRQICYALGVKATPGTLQEGGASFATTHWSVVAQSALTDVPEAETALAKLCEMYWPPIYSFVRRRGYAPPDAQDLTQSFFAYFLRTKAYARTDQLHGKFRCFLLASVKHYLANDWDRTQAIRRGGDFQFISLDQKTAETLHDAAGASDSTAERLFDSRWAKTLAGRALNSLKDELHAEGKLELFEQLKSFLAGDTVIPSYDETAARIGVPRATVKTHVHRLRQRYREIVRREIARTVSSPHEVDDELHYLYNVLAKAA